MTTCAAVWAFPPAPPELAPSRRFPCAATIDNKIYVFGGETKMRFPTDVPDQDPVKRILADLLVYDTETDEWSVVCPAAPSGPACRKGAVLLAYRDTSLFLFGGAVPGVTLNDLWEYNLKEGRWIDRSRQIVQKLLEWLPQQCNATRELLKSEDNYKLTETIAYERPDLYPLPRAYHSAVVYGNKIFVYGGHGVKVSTSTLWSFDLKDYSWQSIPMRAGKAEATDPGCRFGLTTCVYESGMYIFGGQQNGKLVNSSLWRLDLESLTWDQPQVTGLPPPPRTYGASCLVGHRWLVHGGSTANQTCGDSHELDLRKLHWTSAPKLHTAAPLEGHQALCTRAPWGATSLILFGGTARGSVAPEGPVLRCEFFLPPSGVADKAEESRLEDCVVRPVAAAETIWRLYRAQARSELELHKYRRADKEVSEALDNLRLRHDEMCERYEILLQEKTMMARAPQILPPDLTKLKELQSKVEDLQAQLTRYASRKAQAKQESARFEESVRREQVMVEHVSTATRQLRSTRQRIRDDLEYPLSRLTEEASHDAHLRELAETSLGAAELISEDVAAAIASLKTLTGVDATSPLSSSRVSRPKSTARSSSVHDSAKRRPMRPSVSPSRAAPRSKSVSADSTHSAAIRNKCVGKVSASPTDASASAHRHTESAKKTFSHTSAMIRQGSPGQTTLSNAGTKATQQVEETTPLSARTDSQRAQPHAVLEKSDSLLDIAAQHMSSPVQQKAPGDVRGVTRGVSVNRTSRSTAIGENAASVDVGRSRALTRNDDGGFMASPIGVDRATQCGTGVLKLKTGHNADNEKTSARSTVGISKGIGADT